MSAVRPVTYLLIHGANMPKRQYKTKIAEVQQTYNDFQSEGFDPDLSREIHLLRTMLDAAFGANDTRAVTELANAIARLNLDQFKICIRSEAMISKKEAERLFDRAAQIIARNVSEVMPPGTWEVVLQKIGREIQAEIGNSRNSEMEKRDLVRICDGRPGSKTGYAG
jgi:hypothetical protein